MEPLFQLKPYPLVPLDQAGVVLLVDTSNLAHKYHHALPDLSYRGKKTGHVYGFFLGMCHYLRRIPKPVCMVFAFDGYPQQRYAVYKGYKKDRDRKDRTHDIVEDVKHLARLMPGYTIHNPSWEADDVIASFVRRRGDPEIRILSADRDLWQLIDGRRVQCWINPNKRPIGPRYVREETGLGPEHIYLMKVLFGDSSDGIDGVPGLEMGKIAPIVEESQGDFRIFVRMANQKLSDKDWGVIVSNKDVIDRNRALVRLVDRCNTHLDKNVTSPDALKSFLVTRYGCASLETKIDRMF